MEIIQAVLFEPVGCLAEFPGQEFDEIASRLFGLQKGPSHSGSGAYWQLLNLMQKSGTRLSAPEAEIAEGLELHAVDRVELYEDVPPALSELKAMGIELVIASSLSSSAASHFLERFSLNDFFSAVWTRDSAAGVKAAPLAKAIESTLFEPQHVMTLVDTAESLRVAKELGTNPILMINDYEQGKRLALHAPAGGIVSLHELPDAIRLVAESARPPRS